MRMGNQYRVTDKILLRHLIKVFFKHLEKKQMQHAHEVLDIDNIPRHGKQLTITINPANVIRLTYMDMDSTFRELHYHIPKDSKFQDGNNFNIGTIHSIFRSGITNEHGNCEVIANETKKFDGGLKELVEDDKKDLIEVPLYELKSFSTSIYFYVDDGRLAVELVSIMNDYYSRVKGIFTSPKK